MAVRSETGQVVAGTACGIVGLWLYVSLVGPWTQTVIVDLSRGEMPPDGAPFDVGLPELLVFIGGLALGCLAWILLVERRLP